MRLKWLNSQVVNVACDHMAGFMFWYKTSYTTILPTICTPNWLSSEQCIVRMEQAVTGMFSGLQMKQATK